MSESIVAGAPGAGKVLIACGIGNPDDRYAASRHNAGKWLSALLAVQRGEAFRPLRDFAVELAGSGAAGRLAKTTCYMNESGTPVARLLDYLQLAPANLLVAHDELDLPPGEARFKFGGGLAGHNGLADIAARLGTRDFWRLRIGIGKPPEQSGGGADWVLGSPDAADRALIDAALERIAADWTLVQAGEMDAMMRTAHS